MKKVVSLTLTLFFVLYSAQSFAQEADDSPLIFQSLCPASEDFDAFGFELIRTETIWSARAYPAGNATRKIRTLDFPELRVSNVPSPNPPAEGILFAQKLEDQEEVRSVFAVVDVLDGRFSGVAVNLFYGPSGDGRIAIHSRCSFVNEGKSNERVAL